MGTGEAECPDEGRTEVTGAASDGEGMQVKPLGQLIIGFREHVKPLGQLTVGLGLAAMSGMIEDAAVTKQFGG